MTSICADACYLSLHRPSFVVQGLIFSKNTPFWLSTSAHLARKVVFFETIFAPNHVKNRGTLGQNVAGYETYAVFCVRRHQSTWMVERNISRMPNRMRRSARGMEHCPKSPIGTPILLDGTKSIAPEVGNQIP